MVELLSSAHAKCFFAFESLIRALEQPARNIQDQITPTDIYNEFDKYNIWAGNVGAAHSGKRYEISLDYRLREASFLKEQVFKLLSTLRERVTTTARLVFREPGLYEEQKEESDPEVSTYSDLEVDWEEEGKESEDSPWEISDSSDEDGSSSQLQLTHQKSDEPRISCGGPPNITIRSRLNVGHSFISELSRLVESIRFTIICLYRLPIRKPAPLDRIKHGNSTDSAIYQHFDVLYVKDKFPGLQPQAATRLGMMITRRRQILKYRVAHKQSLGSDRVQPQIVTVPEAPLTSSILEGGQKKSVEDHGSQALLNRLVSSQAASSHFTLRSKATTAWPEESTNPVSQEHMDMLFAPSAAGSKSTTASSYGGKDLRIDVPSRPRDDDGQKLKWFECPYCLLTKNISNDRKWKKHVLEDLQPYVCTYGDCDLYDHFFDSRDAWFNHEAQHHRTKWSCNTDGHPEFDSEGDFLLHMRANHNQKFDDIQFRLVKNMFRYPTKSLEGTCNLCHQEPKDLRSHLSRHLKQMAIFALPRANETAGSGQAERDSRSSRYKNYKLDDGEPSRSSLSSSTSVLSDQQSALKVPTSDIYELEDEYDGGKNIPDAVEDQGWDSVTDKFSKARDRTFKHLRVLIIEMNDECRDKMVSLIERIQGEPIVIGGYRNSAADIICNHASPDVIIIGDVSGSTVLTISLRQIRDVTDVPVIAVRQSGSALNTLSVISNWTELLDPSQGDIEEALGSLCRWAPAPPHWRPATPILIVDGLLGTASDISGQYIVYGDSIIQHAQDPLRKLPHAADAPFNSYLKQHEPSCLPDTRVSILHEIYSWADGPDERCIFWLSGLPGTGKSTIARTVARSYHDKQCLAASFFFSLNSSDVSNAGKFITSIAVQLAHNVPASRQHICDAVAEHGDIAQQSLRDQWQHLVCHPLSKLHEPGPYIVVVDALDECENDDDVRMIVQLLAEAQSLNRVRLRVFLTSRPEVRIRHVFGQIADSEHKHFVLQNISPSIANHDIKLFLEHNLSIIAREMGLKKDWPGPEVIMQLVQRASGLFVWAATACRFIHEGQRFADERLQILITGSTSGDTASPEKQLNSMYITVLQTSIRPVYDAHERTAYYSMLLLILGSIVVLASPLSVNSLSALLLLSKLKVDRMLRDLRAVLDIPEDATQPLRLQHPSFRDFLLSKDRCGDERFWVDERSTHERLTSRCLELMSAANGLRQDMCSLFKPGILMEEIDEEWISSSLPPELQYACRYWVDHLERSQQSIADGYAVHVFLQTHLLHWLEAMSLMGESGQCVRLLVRLQTLVAPSASACAGFLHDANRFVLRFCSIVTQTPLQIYSSALVFAPETSVVRQTYARKVPQAMEMLSGREADWGPCRSVLEGHLDQVTAVVFSPDGQLVATASNDSTVRVWETVIGARRSVLEGHSDQVTAVVFSPDGQLVASASDDKTVRVWETATGTCRSVLEGHSRGVTAVVFSPDGQLVASASWDTTVQLWETATGMCHSELKGHSEPVMAVVFSPDGQLVASASHDKTVRLWETATGMCHSGLKGHSGRVNALAFSPDGQLLVSASDDMTVRVWETATGTCRSVLEGHSDRVNAVVSSPDGQLVASASRDTTVRLWETATGTCRSVLEGHSDRVPAVVFSPDGQLVATASWDTTVRVWETATGTCRSVLEGHSDPVHAVVFSPDGPLVASVSWDTTVRLWETPTGIYRGVLEGHSHAVTAVVFSPDGQLVASASDDKTVRLWETATGTCCSVLEGHLDWVMAVLFSPDGQLVASASNDGTVRVWDTATGACCSELEGNSDKDTAMVFSPDGQVLHTHQGDIMLPLSLNLTPPVQQEEQPSPLLVKDQWVLRNTQRSLWLPVEYRAYEIAVHKDLVCLGCPSGRVALLRLR